jgi:hypothetical protein
MVPQNCHPDRSVAEWRDLLFLFRCPTQYPNAPKSDQTNPCQWSQMNCHPDRSAAKWRDLLFLSYPPPFARV